MPTCATSVGVCVGATNPGLVLGNSGLPCPALRRRSPAQTARTFCAILAPKAASTTVPLCALLLLTIPRTPKLPSALDLGWGFCSSCVLTPMTLHTEQHASVPVLPKSLLHTPLSHRCSLHTPPQFHMQPPKAASANAGIWIYIAGCVDEVCATCNRHSVNHDSCMYQIALVENHDTGRGTS